MIFIDSTIPLEGRRLCLIGWSDTGPHGEAFLTIAARRIEPQYSARFRRSDLTGAREYGFFMVFDFPDVDNGESAHLEFDGDANPIAIPETQDTWTGFLETAVDEAFAELVFAWQKGVIPALDHAAMSLMTQRLAGARGQEMRTADTAMTVENVVANTSLGFGILSGWHVTNSINADNLLAFIIDADGHVGFPVLTKSHLREDLAPYSDTYVMTGADGFSGRFSLDGLSKVPEMVIVLLRDAVGCHILSAPVAQVTRDRLAGLMLLLRGSARNPKVGGLLRPELLFDLSGAGSGRTAMRADVQLLLDHDAADGDVREVLRHMLNHIPGNLDVLVLRDFESPALQDAMAGAIRDDTSARLTVRTAGRNPDVAALAADGKTMLYGRSSCLMQFIGWPEVLDAVGRDGDVLGVMLHDPLLDRSELTSQSIEDVRRSLQRNAPFIAAFGHGLSHAAANLTRRMMTVEGGLRLLAIAIARSELPSAFLIDPAANYFEGQHSGGAEAEAQNVAIAQGFDAIALSDPQIAEG